MDINNLEIIFQYDEDLELEKLYRPLIVEKLLNTIKNKLDTIITCIYRFPRTHVYSNKFIDAKYFLISSLYFKYNHADCVDNIKFDLYAYSNPNRCLLYTIKIDIDLYVDNLISIHIFSNLYNGNNKTQDEFNTIFNILNENINIFSNLIVYNINNSIYNYFLEQY